eukprot:scaffold66568_cov17-Tisochrysis_lutea.AAC.1
MQQEVHYNQHGLMLLDGKGIYRLADKWYPVQVKHMVVTLTSKGKSVTAKDRCRGGCNEVEKRLRGLTSTSGRKARNEQNSVHVHAAYFLTVFGTASWFLQAGDAIWMAPYVVQWYAALGTTPSSLEQSTHKKLDSQCDLQMWLNLDLLGANACGF